MKNNLPILVRRLTGTERIRNNELRLMGKTEQVVPNNCQTIDYDSYQITKPVLFVLGGNQTLDKRVANGIAKIPCEMINIEDQAEVLSMVYPIKPGNREIGLVTSVEIQNMVNMLFKPLFVTKFGKKVNIQTALKNARMVTFFCFCYGAEVLLTINKCLEGMLEYLGYSKHDIKLILKQFVSVSWGAGYKNNYNTVFEAKSLDDEVHGWIYRNDISGYLEQNPNEKQNWEIEDGILYLGGGKLLKQDNGYHYYSQQVGEKDSPLKQPNHSPVVISRNENWEVDPKITSIRGRYVSLMMSYVLASAVANSIKNSKGEYVQFDISTLEDFCSKLIKEEENSIIEQAHKQTVIQKYRKRAIKAVIAESGYSESQLLHNFDLLRTEILENEKYRFSLDVTGSLYEHLKYPIKPRTNLGGKVFKIMDVISSEIGYFDQIVVSKDGMAYHLGSKEDIGLSLNLKFYNKEALKNSIMVAKITKKNKKYLAVYDNVGSRDDVDFETLEELVDRWKDLYKQRSLTIDLTQKQILAINNYANAHNIEEENIRYYSVVGITTN